MASLGWEWQRQLREQDIREGGGQKRWETHAEGPEDPVLVLAFPMYNLECFILSLQFHFLDTQARTTLRQR